MRKTPYLAYAVLPLLFLIAIGVRIRDSRDQLDVILYATQTPRAFDSEFKPPNIFFSKVGPEVEKAGLRNGDALVAVNGRAFRGYSDLETPIREARVFGDRIRLQVRHDAANGSSVVDADVPLPPFLASPPAWRFRLVMILNGLVMPCPCSVLRSGFGWQRFEFAIHWRGSSFFSCWASPRSWAM